ncbi:FapA family protein [Alteromonas ponticola]|uniref:FapA family protein n=1 Tax=Alteromonas aquimaris TaxID=2998417 RepID=A0ABT3P7I9_9ALTE|nr:FapA family protein [Alteromonas aquimaris]MCW8108741.1 FapA family protein [Alteromonas aquimaris]
MQGVTVSLDDTKNHIDLKLEPTLFNKEADMRDIMAAISDSEFSEFYISESTLKSAIDKANHYFKNKEETVVSERIGEKRNAEVEFRFENENMLATLVLVTPYGGKIPSLQTLKTLAQKYNVRKGFSIKALKAVIKQAREVKPGTVIEKVCAKGLPPREGKNSRFIPLVPNALERVLRPQNSDGSRVDMRNLGEVICVKAQTEVLRRTPPTSGRKGFDVKGNVLEATSGEWQDFKMGDNTAVSEKDENVLVATIGGMPKWRDMVMNIDDTYICNGVNVGTGHINYDGAVLVNGDVTEKMIIKASGDVTINGFVESAQIESGGDIIITEGAMGKVNDSASSYSCQLTAAGSIHVQHGQGLDLQCTGDITVGRQLAYSRLKCGGSVIVGQLDNPQGNLFACDVVSQNKVIAGTLGAVSGSTLKVDFSPGFNLLLERKDSLDELLRQIKENNLRHKEKLDFIKKKLIPTDLKSKVDEALELLKNEEALLHWIEAKASMMKESKDKYQSEIRLIANKRLYAGVSVKLNNRNWRSEREYDRSQVKYEGHQWHYEPIV